MNKKLVIVLTTAAALITAVALFKFTPGASDLLWRWSSGGEWLLPLISVTALIDSINPCAFSILLLTIAFLFSVGNLRSSILKIGTIYILGIFTAYMLIGFGIFQALHLFNTPHFMGLLGAWLLIALGLINLINEFFPSFPIKLKIPSFAHHAIAQLMSRLTLPLAFVLGALVGLCEFPCTGGPYLLAIGLLHDQATRFSGVGYLLLYNVIFVLPLIVLLFIASNQSLLEKAQQWQKAERPMMRLIGGLAMVALGIIILLL